MIAADSPDSAARGGLESDATASSPALVRAPRVAAVVLAAGRSTRMGSENKLLCPVDGVPMLLRVVDSACASRCSQILIVTGFQAARVEALLGDRRACSVSNPSYGDGLSTSLRCGIQALAPDVDAALIMLGDMPYIGASDVDRLIAAFADDPSRVVVPQRNGRRGNPVLWPRRYFDRLRTLEGDTGGRGLLDQIESEICTLAFAHDGVLRDIDTPVELEDARTR